MSKPTETTRWATDGGADVVEPGSGTKDLGYADAALVDAGELNWILNRTYLWELWLQAFESTAHTWTADQTFDGASIVLVPSTGAGISGEDGTFTGEFDIGTLIVTGTATLNTTLHVIGEVTLDDALNVAGEVSLAGTLTVALFAQFNGDAEFNNPVVMTDALTVGGIATFNGGVVFNDDTTFNGAAEFTQQTTFADYIYVTNNDATQPTLEAIQGGAARAINATSAGSVLATLRAANSGGGPAVEAGAGHIKLTGTHPASDVAFTNRITPANIIKAEVSIGFQNGVDPTISNGGIHHGFNIDSVTVQAGGDIKVFFKTPFASATKYSAICQLWGGSVANPMYWVRTCDVGPCVGAGMDASWCIFKVWIRPGTDTQADRTALWNSGDNCRLNIQFTGEQ